MLFSCLVVKIKQCGGLISLAKISHKSTRAPEFRRLKFLVLEMAEVVASSRETMDGCRLLLECDLFFFMDGP